jgi:hypothetical protein
MRPIIKYFILCSALIISSCEKEVKINPSQANAFIKFFGGFQIDEGIDVKQTSDGGYIVLGTLTTLENGTDIFLIKTDKYGNKEWPAGCTFGGEYDDTGAALQLLSDGSYIVVGTYTSNLTSTNQTDIILIKVSASGNEDWSKLIGGYGDQCGNYVQITSDNGFIITGSTNASKTDQGDFYLNPGGETDVFLLKTNISGDSLWSKIIGFEGDDLGTCVQEDFDDGYIIAGTTSKSKAGQSNTNILIFQTNKTGIVRAAETFGTPGFDEGRKIQVLSDGYVFTGTVIQNSKKNIYLVRLTRDIFAQPVIQVTFGGSNHSEGNAVLTTNDGGFALVGSQEFSASIDIYFVKTDASGNEELSARFGGSGDETGMAVEQTSDGGYIIVGSNELEGNSMITLVKITAQGSLEVD